MPTRDNDATDIIRAKALEFGFADVGFARAVLPEETRRELADYLGRGLHGDMAWMADTADRRGDPTVLWPEAVSVVALAVNYAPFGAPLALAAASDRARVSVHARNRDYHDLVKKRLKRLAGWMHQTWNCQVKVFVDTAPVMEKPLAAATGLGWRGRHTNVVSRRFGSWLFLGEILTTLDLRPDHPHPDRCGACRRCRDACPTGALIDDHRIDARRCISYLTIEHKGHIPRELRPPMGNRVYGCDDCLDACPWNKFAVPTREADFLPRAELTAPRLSDLARLDGPTFAEVFRGSPVKRVGRDRFVRNVLIAIGNSGVPDLATAARERLGDSSPLVRGAAVWALSRLLPASEFARLRSEARGLETEDAVRAEWD